MGAASRKEYWSFAATTLSRVLTSADSLGAVCISKPKQKVLDVMSSACQHAWHLHSSINSAEMQSAIADISSAKCIYVLSGLLTTNCSTPNSNSSQLTPTPPGCSTGDRGFLTTVEWSTGYVYS